MDLAEIVIQVLIRFFQESTLRVGDENKWQGCVVLQTNRMSI